MKCCASLMTCCLVSERFPCRTSDIVDCAIPTFLASAPLAAAVQPHQLAKDVGLGGVWDPHVGVFVGLDEIGEEASLRYSRPLVEVLLE